MKISQLKPGYKILEHKDSGSTMHYEVVSIRQVGKMFEVTFKSAGLASALYPANAFIRKRRLMPSPAFVHSIAQITDEAPQNAGLCSPASIDPCKNSSHTS